MAILAILLSGCSASVGNAGSPTSTAKASTSTSTADAGTATEAGSDTDALVRHLSAVFTAMNREQADDPAGVDPATAGACTARELVRRAGGPSGLAKVGIEASSTRAEIEDAIDEMLYQRVHDPKAEGLNTFIDAMFACGLDKGFQAEFLTQLEGDGNSPAASECLASRVIGDRYLRLVLIVGTRSGSTPDPEVQRNFRDPLIKAVDQAAKGCGVTSWGGS